jgi:hypothetical protein
VQVTNRPDSLIRETDYKKHRLAYGRGDLRGECGPEYGSRREKRRKDKEEK